MYPHAQTPLLLMMPTSWWVRQTFSWRRKASIAAFWFSKLLKAILKKRKVKQRKTKKSEGKQRQGKENKEKPRKAKQNKEKQKGKERQEK